MKIVTFNIRCLYIGDGINSFIHRAGIIYDTITREKPDVIAFQEFKDHHLTMLSRLLPEYDYIGHFRDADYGGEGVYTAVRRDTCHVLGSENVWLSPTPYVPGSRFENQSTCPRTVLQTQILHKESGRVFRVFNTHLDHAVEEARVLGMKAALSFVDECQAKRELPFVLLGDFNAEPDSETIALLRTRSDMRDVTEDVTTTFHDFGKRSWKIDYIYLSHDLVDSVVSVTPWTDERDGIYLSDHYPVCAEINM